MLLYLSLLQIAEYKDQQEQRRRDQLHVSRLKESGECVRLSLTSVILKKNRHDLRYLDAVVSERDENGFVSSLRLLRTSRGFSSWHFPLEEGCIAETEHDGIRYVITKVKYDMYPRFPLVNVELLKEKQDKEASHDR